MFLQQALIYIIWMTCILLLEWAVRTNVKITLIVAISVGWIYFVWVEEKQYFWPRKERQQGFQQKKESLILYFYDFWNTWQFMTLILVLLYYVLLTIAEIASGSSLSPGWFTGIVHFAVTINLLFYGRGLDWVSWILYALKIFLPKMSAFLAVLFLILTATSFLLTKIDGAFDTELPIHVFTNTYTVALFGAFEASEYCTNPFIPASTIVLVLFIVLSFIFVVFTNAMTAFIGEEFANILNYKTAVLAREKAIIILELYCVMSSEFRSKLEEECKWTYKLSKHTNLDKL
jgi:hypothetical protein